MIVIYTYDSNGNRLTQVVNVNTLPLCMHAAPSSNPINWFGYGLFAASAGC